MDSRKPTRRQLQCLKYSILLGSQKEAAVLLGISHSSVKNHLAQLRDRLEVGTIAQAAYKIGWLVIPDE